MEKSLFDCYLIPRPTHLFVRISSTDTSLLPPSAHFPVQGTNITSLKFALDKGYEFALLTRFNSPLMVRGASSGRAWGLYSHRFFSERSEEKPQTEKVSGSALFLEMRARILRTGVASSG